MESQGSKIQGINSSAMMKTLRVLDQITMIFTSESIALPYGHFEKYSSLQ